MGTFAEDLAKIRAKMIDLNRLEVLNHQNFREMYQATLIEILADVERKRKDAVSGMDHLRKQMAVMEGQMMALDQMGAIMYGILDGYVRQQEKALREDEEQKRLRAEAQAAEAQSEPPKPSPTQEQAPAKKEGHASKKK